MPHLKSFDDIDNIAAHGLPFVVEFLDPWSPESARGHSSVDRQGRTDDVGSLVRANKHDGIGNFFGGAHALGRNVGLEEICFVFLRLREVVEHPRFCRTRANDVDTNARGRRVRWPQTS